MTKDYKFKDLDQYLKILIYHDEDDGAWIAHCLEMDHVEEGGSKEDALLNLLAVIVSEIEECEQDKVNPFVPAPKRFWERYWVARPFTLSRDIINQHHIPRNRLDIREIPCECH